MTISINPTVPGVPMLTWTGLVALCAVGLGVALFALRDRVTRMPAQAAVAIAARASAWSVVGARLLHVLDFADYYAAAPFQVLYLWNGGFSAWGALLGGLAGGLWYARRRGACLAAIADAGAIAWLAGLSVFRAGEFLFGARPGLPTSLPWGVVYTHPAAPAYLPGIPQHPVALYELLLVLPVLAAALWAARRVYGPAASAPWADRQGAIAAASLAAYGAIRLLVGFARVDPVHLGLQQAQWIGIAVVVGITGAWVRRARRRKVRSQAPAAADPQET